MTVYLRPIRGAQKFIRLKSKILRQECAENSFFRNTFPRVYNRLSCLDRVFSTESTPSEEATNVENMPLKVLNVAEKNDAAKNIAELLSGGHATRKEGLSVYNKIYVFKYTLLGQASDMFMTSVSGHLLNHEYGEQHRKWYSCNPEQLFDLPITKQCREDSGMKIKKTLEREAKGAKKLIIWTDGDREGENIGFEIIEVCKAANPRLQVYRAKFSEITLASVQRAINNLVQPDAKISAAVDVRAEMDLRTGAAFTRFQTMRLQKRFNSLSKQLISYGSCQFPTMGFVVERYKEIENFIPEAFWKIKVVHEVDMAKVEFNWKRNRLFDKTAAQIYHDICLENPKAKVIAVKSKPKSRWRPLPLDTVELEKLGTRKLKLSAKETMTIAEKLYTSGFISYPRTETNIFPKEMNLKELVEAQLNDSRWGNFANKIMNEFNGPQPRVGKKSDQAHPPIHPLKPSTSLAGNEAKVYELIARHFLACVSQDAVGKETTVEIDINGEKFSANGLMIIHRNFLEVYIYEKWSDKEIPNYDNIKEFIPNNIDLSESETQPPKLLTEADLITLMDKHGIGTDATHAEHIETVKSREYIGIRDTDKLVPGQLGIALCDGYDEMASLGSKMSKPDLRAAFEQDLKLICEGKKDPQVVLQEQKARYKDIFRRANRQASKLDKACAHYLQERPNVMEGDDWVQ